MRIFDFHNDILTEKADCAAELIKYGGRNLKVITAVFRNKLVFSEACALAEKAKYCAFEDAGYERVDAAKLKTFNPRYVGLTWNGENSLGYGCNFNYGLKPKGINFIKQLSGVPIDTAHISKHGFKDIIDNAEVVVDSHTAFSGVRRHKRNLEDWQIKLIIEKKGIIGLCLVGYFLTENKTCLISDVINHIDYFANKFGIENLAVGTDFYGTDYLPENLKDYKNFKILVEKLTEKGYNKEDIDKIFYKNLFDFTEKHNGRHNGLQ